MMKKRALSLVLILAMLFSLVVPALAAGNGGAVSAGHEVLARLPADLPKPARPTTLEQAENRVNSGGWWSPPEWDLTPGKEAVFREIEALSESLTAGKATDAEKAKAIFDWVSQNVKYDYTAYYYYELRDRGVWLTEEQETQISKAADPFYAYARRQAICDGYADLCWLMLSIAEIPAARIAGGSNEKGLNGGGPHAWNAALLDGKWLFFDATWKEWNMAPSYHKTSGGIAFCDGVFQETAYWDEEDNSFPVSYWLCQGFECPANVVMPEGCWDVMAESFKYCTTLKSITLPSTCTIIQTEAFKGCTGLESITIPANVTQVNWRAFQGCTSLKSVTFQNKAVDVWEDAFDGTPLVEDAKEFAIVGGILIKYKGNAREVTIPSGVTAIAEKAFNCSDHAKFYVKKVVIPEGVISIGRNAFSNCRVLTDVTIPKSVTVIGGSAFSGTPWLKNQGDWPVFAGILLAYQGEDMESLTVPDGVRETSDYAFYYNGKTTRSITFPASLTKIGKWALNHSYLQEVNFGGTKAQWDAVDIVPDGGTNWKFRDEETAVHYNFTYPGKPDPQPDPPAQPVSVTAAPTNDKLAVNGAEQTPTVYKIGGSNYFMIRDVAAMLNGTEKQFAVGYAGGKVTVTSGQPYEATGKELAGAPDGAKNASPSNDTVIINGAETGVTVYKIGGSNYFKLRDLGEALNFYVGWETGRGMYIETGKPYS